MVVEIEGVIHTAMAHTSDCERDLLLTSMDTLPCFGITGATQQMVRDEMKITVVTSWYPNLHVVEMLNPRPERVTRVPPLVGP